MAENDGGQGNVISLLSEEDAIKYAGQYVCVSNFGSQKVIAASHNPLEAYKAAEKEGCKDPVEFYVPQIGETFVYERGGRIRDFLD
ncbi:MAG: DUF5678 domain-containing protein [Candidatus Gracilibacteria bacterium]|jgi:hypothetical protein